MARRKRSEARQARQFGGILAGILAAFAGYSLYREHAVRASILAGAAAIFLALPFVALPLWLRLFRLWMRFAEALSWLSTRVILCVFFYLALTPYAWLARLFRTPAIDLAWKDGKGSYWVDRVPPEPTIERYRKSY